MLTSDPQVGLYRAALDRAELNRATLESRGEHDELFDGLPSIEGFERERLLFEEAIEAANVLRPDALIVCGDMLQDWDSEAQATTVLDVAGGLDGTVPLHWVAGNHDLAPDTFRPTDEGLVRYRETFGADRYVVELDAVRLIVINSTVIHNDELVPGERATNLQFLEIELEEANRRGQQPIVCSHHPWFLRTPGEVPDDPARATAIPPEPRRALLDIARRSGLQTLLSGHLHGHADMRTGDLEQLVTSALGLPFGRDPSGYRVVRVFADRVEHERHPLPSGPGLFDEAKRLWAARSLAVE